MAVPNDEYRTRWNAINDIRNITDAAKVLGLPYGTLSKWYHGHRDEFPESVRTAVRRNVGRRAYRSNPVAASYDAVSQGVKDEWSIKEPDSDERADLASDGPKPAGDLVEAIFKRFEKLKSDNERFFPENKRLREENARLRGALSSAEDRASIANSSRLQEILRDVEENQ